MSTTQYTPSLNVSGLNVATTSESTDLISQGGSLAPSTSNAAVIQQWIKKTTGQIAVTPGVTPYWANAFLYSTISITATGTNAYEGGIVLPDGRVIFIPCNAQNVGTFNPITNSFTTVAFTGTAGATIPGGSGAYLGGCLSPDGRIVFASYNATNVGFFNPVTNSFSTLATGTYSGKFVGATVIPGGQILFTPCDAAAYGIYNTNTNLFTTTGITGVPASAIYQGAGVVHPNGNVYFPPFTATNIGIYNTNTNSFTTFSGVTTGGYFGGVLLPDGRIVFVPATATNLGLFNPSTNSYTTFSGAGPGGGTTFAEIGRAHV